MSETTSDAPTAPGAASTSTASTASSAASATDRARASGIAGRLPQATSTDWTTEAVDAIEKAVGAVRRQTVDRADGISKALVYGLIAAAFAVPALFLLLLGVFRLVNSIYLEFGIGVWATWLTLGGIWLLVGLLLWAKRGPATG